MNSKSLFLYEEILILMLDNEKGTLTANQPECMISGGLLAELLLERRISVVDARKKLVETDSAHPVDDPIVDECLQMIRLARKPASLKDWVSRISSVKRLRHKVAQQLCNRGVLQAVDDTVLFVFPRRRYPQIDPSPENEILERLRDAIFRDEKLLHPRTVILISLAHGAGLLDKLFGRKEIKARKKRIEQMVDGEITGTATKEVIEACQAAAMMAAIMPALVDTTSSGN